MKYLVVEVTNDKIEAISNHPSGIYMTGEYDVVVSAQSASIVFDKFKDAYNKAEELANKAYNLIANNPGLNEGWTPYIMPGYSEVGVSHWLEDKIIDTPVWLVIYEIISIPETEKDLADLRRKSIFSLMELENENK